MSRLHALHLTEAELKGLSTLLTSVRDDALTKAHNTHSQYYQALLMRATLEGLIRRIDARLDQIHQKGTQ